MSVTTKPETRRVEQFKQRLRAAGFRPYKIHGGPFQERGLPDLWAVKDGRLLCVEAKMPKGKTEALQLARIAELRRFGVVAGVAITLEELEELIQEFESDA